LKRLAAFCVALVALLSLGFALLGVAPKLVSGCNEALTAPLAAVVIAAMLFAVLAVIAIRLDRVAAYMLVLAVPLLVIAQDWYMQQTLPDALALQCPSPLIR
jgi:hypothetical protein